MGQKTHPIGFRLGTTRTWSSRWFATKGYAGLLHEDVKIRKFIKSALYHAGISRIDIERSANRARISIYTARPGIIIGRKGAEVEKLKNEIQSRTQKEVHLNIEEVVHPELDAQLVAENVALQLQKRVAFRRAMKKAVTSRAAPGRGRDPDRLLGPSGRRRDRAPRVVSRRAGAAAHAPRRHRLRAGGGAHHLRRHRGEGVDLQGRGASHHAADAPRPDSMLMPKRVKYRKAQRGRMKGKAQRGSTLAFGDFGLKALEPAWVTNRQIEAARVTLARSVKRGGKIFIRIFPDKPVTKKPAETRMGKGKGNPEFWVAVVKPGRILYEMEGVDEATAKDGFRLAAQKLGIKTKFVSRTRAL